MLDYTGTFNEDLKIAQGRRVDIEINFIKDGEEYVLTSEDIQDFTYQALTEKELGGVVKKVLNIKFMAKTNANVLEIGDWFNLCFVTSENSTCKLDIFYIRERKVDTKGLIINVEAVDLLTYLNEKDLPIITLEKDIFLRDYMKKLFITVGLQSSISDAIANPKLKLAYLKSSNIQATLTEMAIASNAIINPKAVDRRYVIIPVEIPTYFTEIDISDESFIEIKPFKIRDTPVDVMTYLDMLNDVSVTENGEAEYDQVLIPVFYPNDRQYTKLGNLASTLPGGVSNYSVGSINFKNLTIPQCIHFDADVQISTFNLSGDKCVIRVNNPNLQAVDCNIDIFGSDLSTLSVTDESSDEKVKVVSNQYIQSPAAYDKRIYFGKDVNIKYRGNPLLEVGDTIEIDEGKVLIIEHNLSFNGALSGSIKGVIING